MKFWLKIGLALCAIWAIAAGVIYFVRARKPTPESITAYIDANDIASKTGADRQKMLARVEDMLNRITLDERQQLRHDHVTDRFFRALT
ncbi:MAG TPA: hypothetical protein VG733_17130, partial [Chthoniobacteraceae bacterium]|nr:hypothetical protein [Chthoniobacteraceae bacterium]